MQTRRYPKGADIVREGDGGGNLYLIWQGSAEVWKKDPNNSRRAPYRLALLREGDSFGEMELIDAQPAVATVRAREESVILLLNNMDLYRLGKSAPKTFTLIIMNLAREISRRLRVMDGLAAQSFFRKYPPSS
ncbi:MAG: hypothetical protein APR56_04165 [Methanosaeta sp. SDB]|nr:MAG: hypothetical protein APR56_04165 [Methanosaeta sp. SDB]